MMPMPHQEDLQLKYRHDFHQTPEKVPNGEVSREFHQERPSVQPLEWRCLLVNTAEQAADNANDQTR